MFTKPNSAIHNRSCSYHKALKKKRITEYWTATRDSTRPYYNNLHQYSKNKIPRYWIGDVRYYKTNNKGHKRRIKGNYAPSYNPCKRDKWRQLSMDQDEREFI